MRGETVHWPDSQVNVVIREVHRHIFLQEGAVTASQPAGDLVVAQVEPPELVKAYLNVAAHRKSGQFVVRQIDLPETLEGPGSDVCLCKLVEGQVKSPQVGAPGQTLQVDSLQPVVTEHQVLQVRKFIKSFGSNFLNQIMAEIQIFNFLIVRKSGCWKIFNFIVGNT